ncbi:MAG: DUF4838 domain-containing protein [Armatimonadetes bacterium]|nr:DUF4838 domain-containing protein [Armatimonadota bacterium]
MLPLLLAALLPAAPFTLARDGKPAATIVLAQPPTTVAEFAAQELREHVRKITGADLPVVSDTTPVQGPRILVGPSAATRALGIDPAALRSQEYLIRYQTDTLVLLGKDDSAASSGGPRRVDGRHGKALDFGGEKDVFAIDDAGFDDSRGTLEAWVWLPKDAPPKHHGTILRLDGGDPWTYHIVQRDMNANRISYTTYDGTNGHGLGSKELAEGWHHVAGTWDAAAGKMALWVDGEPCGTTIYVKTTCHGAMLGVGAMAAPVGNALLGRVDEVRVSNVVRDVPQDAAGGPYTPDEHTLCLYHFDEERGGPVNAVTGRGAVAAPPLFGENGTLYAVYDFLEKSCDVRWYAPTELGLVCPSRPTLTVSGKDIRRAPAMIHRWITPTAEYLPGPPDQVPAADLQVWKLRMRIGGQNFWVCHSFYGYYDRFLKEHPNWFAQGYPGQPPQMCYTNPGFIAQVVQDARDYFDGKGKQPGATAEGDVFGLVPMDNMSWCKCAACQALLDVEEQKNQQFNNGKASDYLFAFVNAVAREVRKTHPSKWIGALAYSDYAYYPKRVRLEPNVIVQTCLHTRNWWCPSMEVNDRKVLGDWRAREPGRPLYLWLYYCFPALNARSGSYHYFPGYFAHSVVKQMKLYHQKGVQGIFLEHSSEGGESYLMDQLEFYVTFKLADDPSLNGNALIDEFFRRYYGHAGPAMQRVYARIEDLFGNPRYYPESIRRSPAHQHQNAELAWGSLGTPEHMAELAKLVAAAEAAAQTSVEQQRVAVWVKGQWDYMVAGRTAYQAAKLRQAEAIPRVSVPRLPDAGGDPDRADWPKARGLGGWGTLSGAPTPRKLAAQIGHDGTHLYVRLSEQLDPKTLVPGGQVWDGDDFELFFARERGQSYRQLCVAPNGRLVALAWMEASATWESGAAAHSDTAAPDRWTVSLAFPLDRLLSGGAAPDKPFYANFYRASPGAEKLLAWSPTFASGFQDTARLPELVLE